MNVENTILWLSVVLEALKTCAHRPSTNPVWRWEAPKLKTNRFSHIHVHSCTKTGHATSRKLRVRGLAIRRKLFGGCSVSLRDRPSYFFYKFGRTQDVHDRRRGSTRVLYMFSFFFFFRLLRRPPTVADGRAALLEFPARAFVRPGWSHARVATIEISSGGASAAALFRSETMSDACTHTYVRRNETREKRMRAS